MARKPLQVYFCLYVNLIMCKKNYVVLMSLKHFYLYIMYTCIPDCISVYLSVWVCVLLYICLCIYV